MKFFLILLVVSIGTFIYFLKLRKAEQRKAEQKKPVYNRDEAVAFVTKLEQLGYFKYATEVDRESLKENFITDYDPSGELPCIWDEDTCTPKDYRYYFCDGEDVYEQGGITDKLKDLQPTFQKLNFKCEISNHSEEWDDENQWLNHRITLNGTEYILFKNFTDRGWGEAVMKLAEMLNAELEKQNINERVFLVSGGNDGRLVFLTNEQFQLIDSVYTSHHWKPMDVKTWWGMA